MSSTKLGTVLGKLGQLITQLGDSVTLALLLLYLLVLLVALANCHSELQCLATGQPTGDCHWLSHQP